MIACLRCLALGALAVVSRSGCTPTPAIFLRGEAGGGTYSGPDDEGSWTFDRPPQPGEILGPEGVLEDEQAVRDFGC